MFVYYSWLFTAHICLLHMIVYYTCFSATHVCLLHLGDEVLLMKLKTSKFIQSFLVTGTPPLVWGHLSKTHAPEKENQDFKVFFFVCIQMIFYNCFILIIAKLSLNFNFDKVREQTFLYWRKKFIPMHRLICKFAWCPRSFWIGFGTWFLLTLSFDYQ